MQVSFPTAVGTDLAETDRLVRRAEDFMATLPEIQRVMATASIGRGSFFITLVDPKDRKKTQAEVADTITSELKRYPGIGRVNYIRNAVKATIDAYDGETRMYVFAPDDPIIAAYQRLFPDLFRGADKMPEYVRRLVESAHGFDDSQHRSDNPQRGQRFGDR